MIYASRKQRWVREAECTGELGHMKESPWSEMAAICWGGMMLSCFARCFDHGIVRLELLWDLRVLEVTGVTPYFLVIVVTIEDDVAMVVFAVSVIVCVSLIFRNGSGWGERAW
jgi:hypothetical protein